MKCFVRLSSMHWSGRAVLAKRTIQVPPARPSDGGQLEYWPSDWPPAENIK